MRYYYKDELGNKYNYKHEVSGLIPITEDEFNYVPMPANYETLIEIASLKQQLVDTDYQAIKFAEGMISAEDYAPIKAQRQEWRDRINELEVNISE